MAEQFIEYHVDPGGGDDGTGTGTSGNPWASIQHALDSITRNTTYGDRVNVKTGTDDTLSASLTLAIYGTPSESAPLVIQGYTSTAGDGGKGGIDCDGNTMWASALYDSIVLVDLEVHNAGAHTIINLDNSCAVIRCKVHGCTAGNAIDLDGWALVADCYVYDVPNVGIWIQSGNIIGNFITNAEGTADMNYAMRGANGTHMLRNCVDLDDAGSGVYFSGNTVTVQHNSFRRSTLGGRGVWFLGSQMWGARVDSNIFEGFATGIDHDTQVEAGHILCNSFYNCSATLADIGEEVDLIPNDADQGNETLAASAFTKGTPSPTWENHKAWFAPRNEGNVRGGAWPSGLNLDRGAIQHADEGASVDTGLIRQAWVR